MHKVFLAAVLVGTLLTGSAAAAVDDYCRSCEAAERFYELRGGALAWTGPANAPLYEALIEALQEASAHGLDPEHYHLPRLLEHDPYIPSETADALATDAYLTLAAHLAGGRLDPVSIEPNWTALPQERDLAAYLNSALANGAVRESLEALEPEQRGYHVLKDALARYRTIEAEGGWPAVSDGPALRAGDRGPRVAELRTRLAATGDIPAESDDPELFDEQLDEVVRTFQSRAGLEDDGIVGPRTLDQLNTTAAERVDQIRVNLERWRWLPDDLGRRHIRVNIADFQLEARADGEIERTHDVIVGRLYRRTPVFSASLSYFILNPWWETPVSLAVRDKLPAFRENPDEVSRLGFQIIDREGHIVEPSTIDWATVSARNFPYRIRQAPGPLNAMGEVKFMFPNRHNVYLHDTPSQGLFAESRRDFSSGCIRVRNPLELADWVAAETPDWTPERIRLTAAGDTETRITLDRAIPVHVLYWTVVPDSEGGVRFVHDLYGRDGGVLAALDAPPPPME